MTWATPPHTTGSKGAKFLYLYASVPLSDGHFRTFKFYLAVADDLVYRARVATARDLHQKLVHFGTPPPSEIKEWLTTYAGSRYTKESYD
jgi:hypothetical protein